MFLSAVCWISISAASVNYEDLVADVDNTLNECLSITDEVWNYVGEVDLVRDVRRRDDEKGSDAITDKLGACVSMQKAVDNYRDSQSRLLLVQKFVQWQEKAYLNQLLVPVSKEIGMPIYVASYDGDGAKDFHDNCDGKGPTVVIVESRTGHVFGAYTDVSWSSSTGGQKSSSSFLFQLRPNFIQYDIRDGYESKAVYHHANYGPLFGTGSDLQIPDRALLNDTMAYSNGEYYNVNENDLHGGQNNQFQVKDYVVIEAVSK